MKPLLSFLILTLPILSSCSKDVQSKPHYIFKPSTQKGIVLKVKEESITQKEFIKGIENEIYQLNLKIYEVKMSHLNALLIEKFIGDDPRSKGLSNDEYLNKYINKGASISDSDVDKFIKDKKIPIQYVNDKIKERARGVLEMEMKKKAIDRWIAAKTKKHPVEVYLQKPIMPVFDISVKDAPFHGRENAKVTLVEFSDFQCAYCAKGAKVMDQVKKKYANKVKIVFKNYPLSFHSHAKSAALAGHCAYEQGNKYFWKIHDKMFANQKTLDRDSLLKMADGIGMDFDKFKHCFSDKTRMAKVENDIKQAKDLGVKSTPTFFVNGKMFSGLKSIDFFTKKIDEELAKN